MFRTFKTKQMLFSAGMFLFFLFCNVSANGAYRFAIPTAISVSTTTATQVFEYDTSRYESIIQNESGYDLVYSTFSTVTYSTATVNANVYKLKNGTTIDFNSYLYRFIGQIYVILDPAAAGSKIIYKIEGRR